MISIQIYIKILNWALACKKLNYTDMSWTKLETQKDSNMKKLMNFNN